MSMKRFPAIFLIAVATLLSAACAKTMEQATNIGSKRAFDAWMHVHYQDKVGPVGFGTYIIDDVEGSGAEVADSNYIMVHYEIRKVSDSTFYSYTGEEIARQMGEYDKHVPYVPYIMRVCRGDASQGVLDIISGGKDEVSGKTYKRMRIGGTRTAIIPGWLTSSQKYYDNSRDYINNVTGTDYIYRMTIVNQTKDIIQYQIDSIERYMNNHGMEIWDTTAHQGRGFYYWRDKVREKMRKVEVQDTVKFKEDTSFYINYVGRLLNGTVFDTNIADSAKVWDLYSSSRTYSPVQINCKADSTAFTMGSGDDGDPTSVITGFSLTLWNMHPFESGRGLFTSNFGYGANGTGTRITEYSPLIFEIDVVNNPN